MNSSHRHEPTEVRDTEARQGTATHRPALKVLVVSLVLAAIAAAVIATVFKF